MLSPGNYIPEAVKMVPGARSVAFTELRELFCTYTAGRGDAGPGLLRERMLIIRGSIFPIRRRV